MKAPNCEIVKICTIIRIPYDRAYMCSCLPMTPSQNKIMPCIYCIVMFKVVIYLYIACVSFELSYDQSNAMRYANEHNV
jgi:hypothetical protein